MTSTGFAPLSITFPKAGTHLCIFLALGKSVDIQNYRTKLYWRVCAEDKHSLSSPGGKEIFRL